jgi:dihydroorotase
MKNILIKNAKVVNEGKILVSDVLIKNERIEKISSSIALKVKTEIIDATGLYLLPGLIDAHVHFREPGLTQKANIESESSAAVGGGVTSYFEMPNTLPNTTSLELLEEKYHLAAKSSLANYSFYFGVNHKNIDKALKIDNETVCGITDDGLFFDDGLGGLCNRQEYLEELFQKSGALIALHCEDEDTIKSNAEIYKALYPGGIPFECHSEIRSEEACVIATEKVIEIARKTGTRLHVLHVSTAKEAFLIGNDKELKNKQITGEVCPHHLYFSDEDYRKYGHQIIWNPSIKSELNRKALLNALGDNFLDIIASDHAPHLLHEKNGDYFQMKPGAPSIQHSLQAILKLYNNSEEHLPFVVKKTSHNVAEIFRIKERGFIREGYFADLVLLNLNYHSKPSDLLYKCGWSPFRNINYGNRIEKTIVNGDVVYDQGQINRTSKGKRILFDKFR